MAAPWWCHSQKPVPIMHILACFSVRWLVPSERAPHPCPRYASSTTTIPLEANIIVAAMLRSRIIISKTTYYLDPLRHTALMCLQHVDSSRWSMPPLADTGSASNAILCPLRFPRRGNLAN